MMADEVSLFTSPLETITFEDVKAFCELGIDECETIEYKGEESFKSGTEQIVKCIAAMANTDGGIILLGVPEIRQQGRKTSKPGSPKGYTPKRNKINSEIANRCRALLEPPFIPDMSGEIPTDDPDKKVTLIRIDKDKVPILPIYHREAGIIVRSGEDCIPAHPNQIRLMFEENEKQQNQFAIPRVNDIDLPGFFWCNVGLQLPLKRYSRAFHWNDQQIEILKNLILNHAISGEKVWTDKYQTQAGAVKLIFLEPIKPKRTLDSIEFSTSLSRNPDIEADNIWYHLYFNTNGFIAVSIGFGWKVHYPPFESIATAIYAAIDLFNQQEIRECYPETLWDIGKYIIYCHVNQFPELVTYPVFSMQPSLSFPAKGNKINQLEGIFVNLDPEEIAKGFVSQLMASVGCLNFEKSLEQHNIQKIFEIFPKF
jgi:hypothetical protein